MHPALQVHLPVRDDADLRGEVEVETRAGHPRRSLLEDDVSLGNERLRLPAAAHAPGRELHVLIHDGDELSGRRLRGEEVLALHRLLALRPALLAGIHGDLQEPALVRRLELDVEIRALAEPRREGVGVE